MSHRVDPGRGLYDATRAAALSGVPKSTLHYWARHDVLVPEAAAEPRTRLWSWGDLVVLRLLHWLRQDKEEGRPSPMVDVRNLVGELRSGTFALEDLDRLVAVCGDGRVAVRLNGDQMALVTGRQLLLSGSLDLVRPYRLGPDLLAPRKHLGIIPGKLSGEPHVRGSRVSTASLWALSVRGYGVEQIGELYPELIAPVIAEALSLERDLAA
jgi:uncharacterized protein (DUF433 family)